MPQPDQAPVRRSRSASEARRAAASTSRKASVGGGLVEHAGGVAHGDPQPPGGAHVDVVVADGHVAPRPGASPRRPPVSTALVDAVGEQAHHGVDVGASATSSSVV